MRITFILSLCCLFLSGDALIFSIQHKGRRIGRSERSARSLNVEWNDSKNSPPETNMSSRRIFLLATGTFATATAARTSRRHSPALMSGVPQAMQWIDANCDRRFLHAVVASDYRFLYRGIDDDISSRNPTIRTEVPDLLSPETYNSATALKFFEDLEQTMGEEPVKPSNGHLATTSARDAAQWGTAASIWPMAPAHYAWFSNGGLFYDLNRQNHDLAIDRSKTIVDGKDCGKDSLEDALCGDSWEVMVATESFLAVPISMEQELREGLQKSFLL